MQLFSLPLNHGGVVTGRVLLPLNPPASQFLPLRVCVHGGSYDSEYWDAGSYFITQISDALHIPVVAIDRPGYGETTPPPPLILPQRKR
ncbi:hypothetical protein N7532_008952 [Penicillium argentinense]|uniref:AB hydrolase-1 domain-containing protein n=1 Tax=Penicillium argentinense TaxID=1131581 RepID=A0A9W9K255_9EURO|nr:uncharacterized protein N7532_008952 [Penicillium argentinense]KAJ5090268.1 hypothetical protein N7532_008952 [Penicillium argentinense]